MTDTPPLYKDSPDPASYQEVAGAAPGRPTSNTAAPYSPPRLGKGKPRLRHVLLFTVDDYPEAGDVFEGVIPDPVPASHYAQLLLDTVELGQVMAEARMINRVVGEDNLKALAAAPDITPDDLKAVLGQAYERAMGPYRAGLGNGQSG